MPEFHSVRAEILHCSSEVYYTVKEIPIKILRINCFLVVYNLVPQNQWAVFPAKK